MPDVELDYQRERQVSIRLGKERIPWMTIETKERPSIRVTWNVPNDVIAADRLADLDTPGRMVTAGAVDRITLHLSRLEEVQSASFRSLIEHGYSNS